MKRFFLFTLTCFTYLILYGQGGSFYVHIPDSSDVPIITQTKSDGMLELTSFDPELNNLFRQYEIMEFKKAFPTAETPFLKEIFEIACSDLKLMNNLNSSFPDKYPLVEKIDEPILLYEPNDFGLNGGWLVEQSNLALINTPQAWDITLGDVNIILGITDTKVDLAHPELNNKIVELDGSNTSTIVHGTDVCSIMASDTDNDIGIAGTGFNCNIHFSSNWGNHNEVLRLAQSGVRVINLSWGSCYYSSILETLYEEIRYSNNCLVIAAAGNNSCSSKDPTDYFYPASYNNVLSVISVGHSYPVGYNHPIYGQILWEDCHQYEIRLAYPDSFTHQHNDRVDICAPGYAVPTATDISLGSYRSVFGTSVAAPHVVGVAGLMLSVNSCLTDDELEQIIVNTADSSIYNISYNQPYIGMLGSGRLDAYNAVLRAIEMGTIINQDAIYSGTQTITAPSVLSAAGRVTSGSDITFQAPYKVELRPGFEVELGAKFEIIMDYTCSF